MVARAEPGSRQKPTAATGGAGSARRRASRGAGLSGPGGWAGANWPSRPRCRSTWEGWGRRRVRWRKRSGHDRSPRDLRPSSRGRRSHRSRARHVAQFRDRAGGRFLLQGDPGILSALSRAKHSSRCARRCPDSPSAGASNRRTTALRTGRKPGVDVPLRRGFAGARRPPEQHLELVASRRRPELATSARRARRGSRHG